MPEPLFIEMIAQAGGVLFGLGVDFKKEVILAKIEGARFEKTVVPPCRLVIEARNRKNQADVACPADPNSGGPAPAPPG